jgi:hypothetical protein
MVLKKWELLKLGLLIHSRYDRKDLIKMGYSPATIWKYMKYYQMAIKDIKDKRLI